MFKYKVSTRVKSFILLIYFLKMTEIPPNHDYASLKDFMKDMRSLNFSQLLDMILADPDISRSNIQRQKDEVKSMIQNSFAGIIRIFDYFDKFVFNNDNENKKLKEKLLSDGMHMARMHAEKNHTYQYIHDSAHDDAANIILINKDRSIDHMGERRNIETTFQSCDMLYAHSAHLSTDEIVKHDDYAKRLKNGELTVDELTTYLFNTSLSRIQLDVLKNVNYLMIEYMRYKFNRMREFVDFPIGGTIPEELYYDRSTCGIFSTYKYINEFDEVRIPCTNKMLEQAIYDVFSARSFSQHMLDMQETLSKFLSQVNVRETLGVFLLSIDYDIITKALIRCCYNPYINEILELDRLHYKHENTESGFRGSALNIDFISTFVYSPCPENVITYITQNLLMVPPPDDMGRALLKTSRNYTKSAILNKIAIIRLINDTIINDENINNPKMTWEQGKAAYLDMSKMNDFMEHIECYANLIRNRAALYKFIGKTLYRAKRLLFDTTIDEVSFGIGFKFIIENIRIIIYKIYEDYSCELDDFVNSIQITSRNPFTVLADSERHQDQDKSYEITSRNPFTVLADSERHQDQDQSHEVEEVTPQVQRLQSNTKHAIETIKPQVQRLQSNTKHAIETIKPQVQYKRPDIKYTTEEVTPQVQYKQPDVKDTTKEVTRQVQHKQHDIKDTTEEVKRQVQHIKHPTKDIMEEVTRQAQRKQPDVKDTMEEVKRQEQRKQPDIKDTTEEVERQAQKQPDIKEGYKETKKSYYVENGDSDDYDEDEKVSRRGKQKRHDVKDTTERIKYQEFMTTLKDIEELLDPLEPDMKESDITETTELIKDNIHDLKEKTKSDEERSIIIYIEALLDLLKPDIKESDIMELIKDNIHDLKEKTKTDEERSIIITDIEEILDPLEPDMKESDITETTELIKDNIHDLKEKTKTDEERSIIIHIEALLDLLKTDKLNLFQKILIRVREMIKQIQGTR